MQVVIEQFNQFTMEQVNQFTMEMSYILLKLTIIGIILLIIIHGTKFLQEIYIRSYFFKHPEEDPLSFHKKSKSKSKAFGQLNPSPKK